MKDLKRLGLAAILVASLAGDALAGARATNPVTVLLSEHMAWGAMGSARNSTDTIQYIGCVMTGYPSGDSLLYCMASSAAGVTASCTISNPLLGMTHALAAVSSDSRLKFTWDSNGTCTLLTVENVSNWEPKR